MLDEVDAPLDDANVERYCDLLDDMARTTDTRFVVITHNPITMSRMDRLFGVTMAERGVSTLTRLEPTSVQCPSLAVPLAGNQTHADFELGVALNSAYVTDDSSDGGSKVAPAPPDDRAPLAPPDDRAPLALLASLEAPRRPPQPQAPPPSGSDAKEAAWKAAG